MGICKDCGAEIIFIMQSTGERISCEPDSLDFNDAERVITLITADGRRVKIDPYKRYSHHEKGYPLHLDYCKAKRFSS